MINKAEPDWVPVSLNVGGWRQAREEALGKMVSEAVNEIKEGRSEVALPPMSASQRRLVHLALTNFPDFKSESEGDEPNRKVVIKKA